MDAVHAIKAQLLLGPEQLQAALVNHVYIEGGLDSLCMNFDNEGYPIVVRGYPLNANVNLKETRRESKRVLSDTDAEVIIQPGFGGLDGKVRKTLGKGGSDAVAFASAYGYGADKVLIYTDVEGIKQAIIDGIKTETVEEISLNEAVDGAILGAKLPNRSSLEPLIEMSREQRYPEVYIAHHSNQGKRTRIIEKSSSGDAVRFTSGRVVSVYEVSGNFYGLLNKFREHGVDHHQSGSEAGGIILLNQKGREQGEMLVDYFDERGDINILEKWQGDWIGIIGEGMRKEKGISAQVYTALSEAGINIEACLDPGHYSIGAVIKNGKLKSSMRVLYDKFLRSEATV